MDAGNPSRSPNYPLSTPPYLILLLSLSLHSTTHHLIRMIRSEVESLKIANIFAQFLCGIPKMTSSNGLQITFSTTRRYSVISIKSQKHMQKLICTLPGCQIPCTIQLNLECHNNCNVFICQPFPIIFVRYTYVCLRQMRARGAEVTHTQTHTRSSNWKYLLKRKMSTMQIGRAQKGKHVYICVCVCLCTYVYANEL